MAYSSLHGRKPMERASKISHGHIINNPVVEKLLSECTIPRPPDPGTLDGCLEDLPALPVQPVRAVVAVDGSMREEPVRRAFPSASVTFFSFGPLLFHLEALRDLDREPFIAPEDLVRLKNIQRYTLALPTKNVSWKGMTLTNSIRRALHEFFQASHAGDEPLLSTLRWLLFSGWDPAAAATWTLERCPSSGCSGPPLQLTMGTPDEFRPPRAAAATTGPGCRHQKERPAEAGRPHKKKDTKCTPPPSSGPSCWTCSSKSSNTPQT